MTRNCVIHIFRWTYRRRLIFAGSARVTRAAAVRDRFLRSERAAYISLALFKVYFWYSVSLKWTYRPVGVIRLMWHRQDRQLSPRCSGTGIFAEGSGSSGIWRFNVGWIGADVTKYHSAFQDCSPPDEDTTILLTPGTTDPTTEPYVPEDLNPASYRGTECW